MSWYDVIATGKIREFHPFVLIYDFTFTETDQWIDAYLFCNFGLAGGGPGFKSHYNQKGKQQFNE